MEEIMAKSKMHRAAKAKSKDAQEEATDRLDANMKELLGELTFREKGDRGGGKIEDEDVEYEKLFLKVREEERQAKAADRTKSEEEVAREEREKLEKLEKARIARMKGEMRDEEAESGDEGSEGGESGEESEEDEEDEEEGESGDDEEEEGEEEEGDEEEESGSEDDEPLQVPPSKKKVGAHTYRDTTTADQGLHVLISEMRGDVADDMVLSVCVVLSLSLCVCACVVVRPIWSRCQCGPSSSVRPRPYRPPSPLHSTAASTPRCPMS
jgi:hypothetical protein